MRERLRAKRGFNYPKDPVVAAAVRTAGGLSQMPPAAREAAVRLYVRVEPGGWCDDMPADAAARYLERGDVERVQVDDVPAPRASQKGGS
jgi:hypothetical protein